jgi:hypothetical protein
MDVGYPLIPPLEEVHQRYSAAIALAVPHARPELRYPMMRARPRVLVLTIPTTVSPALRM